MPTSVQQSVPAWSLFCHVLHRHTAVGYVHQGTPAWRADKAQDHACAALVVMAGKAIPYFIINQLQIALMLAVGFCSAAPWRRGAFRWQLPGRHSPAYGKRIPRGSRLWPDDGHVLQDDRAVNHLRGTSVIVFAALGGIMVPKFLMPQFIQSLSILSPLSWGLGGGFS